MRRRNFKRDFKKDEFDSTLLDLSRVSHTRAGGKKLRFRAIMVVGNKKGKIGVASASGLDVSKAIEKSTRLAKKKVIQIPIVNDTIPHEVSAKFSSAKVLLKPQQKGRGLVAGGTVRVICTLAGIENISSKVLGGTKNKLNNAMATMKALKKLKVRGIRTKKVSSAEASEGQKKVAEEKKEGEKK